MCMVPSSLFLNKNNTKNNNKNVDDHDDGNDDGNGNDDSGRRAVIRLGPMMRLDTPPSERIRNYIFSRV